MLEWKFDRAGYDADIAGPRSGLAAACLAEGAHARAALILPIPITADAEAGSPPR